MSDLESDTCDSPLPCTVSTTTFLSPFLSVVPSSSCTSRATSESNLSSSGYSSMASPSPSMCGSSNPLCISESEDTASPTFSYFTSTSSTNSGPGFVRRPSPLLKSPSCDSESSDAQHYRSIRLSNRVDRAALFSRHISLSLCSFSSLVLFL